MLKKLFTLIIIFSSCYGMEQQQEEKEPRSIADHYYPTDVWRYIAHQLPGDDLFLNTDIARNLILNKKTEQKIMESFLNSLKQMHNSKALTFVKNFYKTSHVKAHNCLRQHFRWEKIFMKHLSDCHSATCDTCEKLIHNRPTQVDEKIKTALKELTENHFFTLKEKLVIYLVLGATVILLLPTVFLVSVLSYCLIMFTLPLLLFSAVGLLFSPVSLFLKSDISNPGIDYLREIGFVNILKSIEFFNNNFDECKEMFFVGVILSLNIFLVYQFYAKAKINKYRRIKQLFE